MVVTGTAFPVRPLWCEWDSELGLKGHIEAAWTIPVTKTFPSLTFPHSPLGRVQDGSSPTSSYPRRSSSRRTSPSSSAHSWPPPVACASSRLPPVKCRVRCGAFGVQRNRNRSGTSLLEGNALQLCLGHAGTKGGLFFFHLSKIGVTSFFFYTSACDCLSPSGQTSRRPTNHGTLTQAPECQCVMTGKYAGVVSSLSDVPRPPLV